MPSRTNYPETFPNSTLSSRISVMGRHAASGLYPKHDVFLVTSAFYLDPNLCECISKTPSCSSVAYPQDEKEAEVERCEALRRILSVPDMRSIRSHDRVLAAELKTCNIPEHSPESLPLILHQFFLSQVSKSFTFLLTISAVKCIPLWHVLPRRFHL